MKIKSLSIVLIALSMGFLVSCKDENKEATPTQSDVETTENPKTTAELNPEHGQPGHRCDIPVGAPLNSESSQQQQESEATETGNPASNSSPVRVKKDQPDVNPPHGEPGHDCTVPVGAPLDN